MRRILSVDGGGLRGALTSCFLAALEEQLGKPCREVFDMVAGTSTGALIAAAVAVGLPASQILGIYRDRARQIFPFSASSVEGWANRIAKGHAYDPNIVRRILLEEFGATAVPVDASTRGKYVEPEWALNDLPIKILIPAKGIDQHPWYFVQDNPRNAQYTGTCSLIDCAVASACAPTYFPPWYVPPSAKGLVGWCFDGGVGVDGNPTYRACVEAFCYDDFDPADTALLSLGTGYFPDRAVNPPSGLLGTLTWTLDALVQAPINESVEDAQREWPGVVTRMDWQLPRAIDMADASAVPELIELGQSLAAKVDWRKVLKA